MSNSNPITREELTALLDPLKKDVSECVSMLREQNTQLNETKTDVAVLKDRQPTRLAATWGATAGAFAGALIAVVEWILKR